MVQTLSEEDEARAWLDDFQQGKPGPGDAKARAVQEMMERIKNGVVLRPAKEQRVALSQAAALG
ncbi:hypothetical protein Anapl_17434 [Anas platyrhynchos]|uniref:Uncharacterized protein n=1 Tax=Anas platyrhynchos TaxID=8839 RepID=R0KNW5_ANAPL|nr:hypothetical protein Anapl_17434 [Anas platyrhynchos]